MVIGNPGSGKSFITQYLIEQLGKKHATKIYYISSIYEIEDKIEKLRDDYEVEFYNSKDLYQKGKDAVDVFQKIFDKLMLEKKQGTPSEIPVEPTTQ